MNKNRQIFGLTVFLSLIYSSLSVFAASSIGDIFYRTFDFVFVDLNSSYGLFMLRFLIWIALFAALFVITEKLKFLGEGKTHKNVRIVIALSISLIGVLGITNSILRNIGGVYALVVTFVMYMIPISALLWYVYAPSNDSDAISGLRPKEKSRPKYILDALVFYILAALLFNMAEAVRDIFGNDKWGLTPWIDFGASIALIMMIIYLFKGLFPPSPTAEDIEKEVVEFGKRVTANTNMEKAKDDAEEATKAIQKEKENIALKQRDLLNSLTDLQKSINAVNLNLNSDSQEEVIVKATVECARINNKINSLIEKTEFKDIEPGQYSEFQKLISKWANEVNKVANISDYMRNKFRSIVEGLSELFKALKGKTSLVGVNSHLIADAEHNLNMIEQKLEKKLEQTAKLVVEEDSGTGGTTQVVTDNPAADLDNTTTPVSTPENQDVGTEAGQTETAAQSTQPVQEDNGDSEDKYHKLADYIERIIKDLGPKTAASEEHNNTIKELINKCEEVPYKNASDEIKTKFENIKTNLNRLLDESNNKMFEIIEAKKKLNEIKKMIEANSNIDEEILVRMGEYLNSIHNLSFDKRIEKLYSSVNKLVSEFKIN